MDLKEHIYQIRDAIKAGRFPNEAAISQGIVLRLLQVLGWPIFDSEFVSPEYTIEGKRVDFALCHPRSKPIVFIEVKQIGKTEGAESQLFEYAFYKGVPMAILTDGQEWHFYLPGEQGKYNERRVYKLDILEREIDESVLRLMRYLNYDEVCSGKAIEAARMDYKNVTRERQVKDTLPIAWEKLIDEPDELLVELIADKVESLCGYKPDLDTVTSFLNIKTDFGIRATESIKKSPYVPNQHYINKSSKHKHYQIGFKLFGQEFRAKNARGVMIKVFEEFATRDATFFERFAALPKHGNKRRYVARSKEELYPDRSDLCELYSHYLQSGWWIGVNYSKISIRKIIELACDVAEVSFGHDLIINLG